RGAGARDRSVSTFAVRLAANSFWPGGCLHQSDAGIHRQFRAMKFSFQRLRGIMVKEFTQMRRDRLTFAMMFGIPLIQLILFGYAINSDPRHLPAAVLLADRGPQGRTVLAAMKNSTYFDFVRQVNSEEEGHELLARGNVQFVVNIPQNF